MKNLIRVYDCLPYCVLDLEIISQANEEKELCLACIAGGKTPEEIAGQFHIPLQIVEMIIEEDLWLRDFKSFGIVY